MIRAENLSKRFGDIQAVREVSFTVEPGQIYGLLGPNGAGKTTTLSMVSGLLAPDSGRVLLGGADLGAEPLAVKQGLGVVPQEVALYEELTALENLRFWGGLYGLSGKALAVAVDRVLEQVGLAGRAKEPVKGFSGGMKRRLNLALGLVHGPRAVLMDEPTVGIDPQARLNILEVVEGVAAGGAAVLYTTHYLEEAERLCRRIAILDGGVILAEGSLEELKRQVGEEEVVTLRGAFDLERTRRLVAGVAGARVVSAEPGRLVLAVAGTEGDEGGERGAVRLLARVLGEDLAVEAISIEPPSLNLLFLRLTGRELRD